MIRSGRCAERGITHFKIPFGADLDLDFRRLAAIREVISPEATLAEDACAAFDSVKDALRAWRALDQFSVAFLDDPFAANAVPRIIELPRSAQCRVAFGESVSDLNQMDALAHHVDVLRPDATHQLGVSGYLQLVPMRLSEG